MGYFLTPSVVSLIVTPAVVTCAVMVAGPPFWPCVTVTAALCVLPEETVTEPGTVNKGSLLLRPMVKAVPAFAAFPKASRSATLAVMLLLLPIAIGCPAQVELAEVGSEQLTNAIAEGAAAFTSIPADVPLIEPSLAVIVTPVAAATSLTPLIDATPLVKVTGPDGSVGVVAFGLLVAVLVKVMVWLPE